MPLPTNGCAFARPLAGNGLRMVSERAHAANGCAFARPLAGDRGTCAHPYTGLLSKEPLPIWPSQELSVASGASAACMAKAGFASCARKARGMPPGCIASCLGLDPTAQLVCAEIS